VSQLVVQELLPAAFDILGEPNPVADRERDLLPLKHAKIARLVKRQSLLDAILSDNDISLLTPKDFPLFAAFKTLFSDTPQWGRVYTTHDFNKGYRVFNKAFNQT